MKSSRLYEKEAFDAPEIPTEYILAPLDFSSVQNLLFVLRDLQDQGHITQIQISALNYEYRCNIPKEDLYKLFPVDLAGRTYYLRQIDELINTERTSGLNALVLKKIDSNEGVQAVDYRNHIAELEYNQLLVDMLLSCTFIKTAKNIDEDDDVKKSQQPDYRLVNMVLPTYVRTSDKFNYEDQKLKARNRPLVNPKTPTQITILFPCGFKMENATECMLDYTSMRNHTAQSLIELYYRERFSRQLELIQTLPARVSYTDPADIGEDKNTIREIESQRKRVESALTKLINRLVKHQKRLNELHQTLPAALKVEFPYGFLTMDITLAKLYAKEKCTRRVTNKWYPLTLLTIPTPLMGAGLESAADLIKHRPNAKRNLDYAKDIYEYRRLARHNGHGVIPHVPQDEQEARQDQHMLQLIRKKINRRCGVHFGKYSHQHFDEKALVHLADIVADITQRKTELQNYLTLIQEIGLQVRNAQLSNTAVSSNSSSLHYAAPSQSSSSTSNALVPYDASQQHEEPRRPEQP